MSRITHILISAGSLLLLISCVHLPKQNGTWTGVIVPRTLSDSLGRPQVCNVFLVTSGPVLDRVNPHPTEYVMVNEDDTPWQPLLAPFKNARVRGTILPGSPITKDRHGIIDPNVSSSWIFIIRVKKAEPQHTADRTQQSPPQAMRTSLAPAANADRSAALGVLLGVLGGLA